MHNRVLGENVLHCALREAARRNDDAVILTGGLIYMDLKRSDGLLSTHRRRLSGIECELEKIDSGYRERAKAILAAKSAEELAYYTLRERFLMLLLGFRKVSTGPDGKPVFPGKVYIVFGLAEEEFIEAAVQAEIRYSTAVRRLELQAEINTANALKANALKQSGVYSDVVKELEGEIKRLVSEFQRTIISNTMRECHNVLMEIITATLVRWIEEAIPNSKVVTQGSAFLKVGRNIVEIHQMRNPVATEMALDEFMRDSAGRRANDRSLPDVAVIATPLSVNHHAATVQRVVEGKPKTTFALQVPCALDRVFLRERLSDVVRVGSPIEKLIRNPRFEPGVTRLRWNSGLCSPELISIEALKNGRAGKSGSVRKPEPYLHIEIDSDEYFGNAWRKYYFDAAERSWLGHSAAVKALLRRDFHGGRLLPIHGSWALDDPSHGNHFGTQEQPHEHLGLWETLEGEFRAHWEMAKTDGTPARALQILREDQDRALEQMRLQGYHWTQTQMEAYIRYLRENRDHYAAVILRSIRSDVRFIGIGEILGKKSDTRDIGCIVKGTGNHFSNTVDRKLTEGFVYTSVLQEALRQEPKLRDADLYKLVRAPIHGNLFIGLGRVVGGEGGYPWTFSLRADPSRKSPPNGDPLQKYAENVCERGDFAGIFGGSYVLHLSGDIHRNGHLSIPGALIVSCGTNTANEPYGLREFSNCDTSAVILSLPVHGPDAGPIVAHVLNHDWVRDNLADPSKNRLGRDLAQSSVNRHQNPTALLG